MGEVQGEDEGVEGGGGGAGGRRRGGTCLASRMWGGTWGREEDQGGGEWCGGTCLTSCVRVPNGAVPSVGGEDDNRRDG